MCEARERTVTPALQIDTQWRSNAWQRRHRPHPVLHALLLLRGGGGLFERLALASEIVLGLLRVNVRKGMAASFVLLVLTELVVLRLAALALIQQNETLCVFEVGGRHSDLIGSQDGSLGNLVVEDTERLVGNGGLITGMVGGREIIYSDWGDRQRFFA
ncbi:hypothetical protein B0H13DRAFT_2300659 [Mycena leptocephala]|nr:hypothetical protein B0H13DRAFT_2300659 [Mycena leptocephala]